MPLVFPPGHPAANTSVPRSSGERALRIGIVNIMPKIEAYEPLLLGPLSRVHQSVEPVFIRLTTHSYGSSDHDYLGRFYVPFEEAISAAPLDGLILTGAPVEELEFEEVRYWRELCALLEYTRAHSTSTLGICWGGLALGALVGIPKVMFQRKLFGVFENAVIDPHSPLLANQGERFLCAHSRHAGADDRELEAAQADGRLTLLSHAADTGYTVFATPDYRYVMHLGHPEYVADRLAFEWSRDRDLGRSDVEPPRNFDPSAPETTWYAHRESLFDRWTSFLAEGAAAHATKA